MEDTIFAKNGFCIVCIKIIHIDFINKNTYEREVIKMTKYRTFNICQYEVNPKSGEALNFSEQNILDCVSHKTIKKWAYICHDKDISTSEDEASNGFKEGTLKPRHWHIVLKSDKAIEIDTIAKWLGMDSLYDELDEINATIKEREARIRAIENDRISRDKIYAILIHFNQIYDKMSDIEKKDLIALFIDKIEIFEDKQANGRRIKQIDFKFPIVLEDGEEGNSIIFPTLENECGDGMPFVQTFRDKKYN